MRCSAVTHRARCRAAPRADADIGALILTPMRSLSTSGSVHANRALGCDFFEGVVMKRADSPYPVQLRTATEEFRGWVKHRFLT